MKNWADTMSAQDDWRQVRSLIQNRQGGMCLRCTGAMSDVHHRRRRGVKDGHTDCPCNLVGLCRTCHSWVHANPVAARAAGWIVSTSEPAPSLAPLLTRYSPILLLCDGTDRVAVVTPVLREA